MLRRVQLGFLSAAVVLVLSNAQNVNLSTAAWPGGSAVWASGRPKIVIIPAGVTIGSLNPAVPALDTGTGWGGQLTIINNGSIQGAGGTPNSGQGGTALLVRSNGGNKPSLYNYGSVYGGGGAGGVGGVGGPGYYYSTAQEGPILQYQGYPTSSHYYYQYSTSFSGLTKIVWNGSVLYDRWDGGQLSVTIGSYTYYRGAFSNTNAEIYYVYRQWQVYNPTSGGAGGAGGRGQGYAQSAAGGSAGAAGGANAGTGGTGGAGAAFGGYGATGATGSAGNAGGGGGGGGGGAPGHGIEGDTNVDVIVTGTILGL